jgi:hypothetical protein
LAEPAWISPGTVRTARIQLADDTDVGFGGGNARSAARMATSRSLFFELARKP